jgi:hypothetical protein
MEFASRREAADEIGRLEYEHALALFCKVSRTDQAVVARADND